MQFFLNKRLDGPLLASIHKDSPARFTMHMCYVALTWTWDTRHRQNKTWTHEYAKF